MTAQSKIEAPPNGLALLRAPFADNHISKLPKETRAQIDKRKTDRSVMVWKCEECGGAHHKDAVHLDYVGHAALTDRLLDADIEWSWEPVAFNAEGLPAFDRNGGLWIKLTVCGMTRLGYGHAGDKSGGDAVKEVIGDALRNAAMRFGAALDLWHKGDLHIAADDAEASTPDVAPKSEEEMPDAEWSKLVQLIEATGADRGKMLKLYGVSNLRMLNKAQYADALELLNKKLADKVKAETNAQAKETVDA